MKEDFLHYIWKFKKFDFTRAATVDGLPVTLIDAGTPNVNSGPDFFNARLKIGEQLWAGNVEIHLKSSDWYTHQHESDPAYDNVILHVVWEDDVEIYRSDNSSIPTLELQNLVSGNTLLVYSNLLLAPNNKWINCEADFEGFEDFHLRNWMERLYLERLEKKSVAILELLKKSGNNWEAVLFQLLAKNFGLKVNSAAFLSMAQSLEFIVVQKCRDSQFMLESLFLGQSGILDKKQEEIYYSDLKEEYQYLKIKFQLENKYVERPKYFRLRPDNFPNLRLSQLATLYHRVPHIFSKILKVTTTKEIYELFAVGPSEFWKSHYTFEKSHNPKKKDLTTGFIDLLIINTIVPVRFCFEKINGIDDPSALLTLLEEVKAEKNSIIDRFNKIKPGIASTAMDSQSLLHMKNEYCDKNACMQCNLGAQLLRVRE